jgi:hypothetical protein
MANKQYRHGYKGTREYTVWQNMKQRCLNSKSLEYKNYGGRGITICEEWLKFKNFIKDMGNKPEEDSTIERIDVNKGYNKENCIWLKRSKQGENRTDSVYVEWNGERKVLKQWATQFNIKLNTLHARLRKGYKPPELFLPKLPTHKIKQ